MFYGFIALEIAAATARTVQLDTGFPQGTPVMRQLAPNVESLIDAANGQLFPRGSNSFLTSATARHINSRARCFAVSRKASNNGVLLPRHSAPIMAGGKCFKGNARTLSGNDFFGTATESPIPRPLDT